jgi:outer membrane lipopolysaccharide assembly protein LptE/RlpB
MGFIFALIVQTAVLVSWASTFKAEFVAFREDTRKSEVNLRDYIDAKTRDRITSRTVDAEFRSRDSQITGLQRANERLLTDIRQQHIQMISRLDRIEKKIDSHLSSKNGNGH